MRKNLLKKVEQLFNIRPSGNGTFERQCPDAPLTRESTALLDFRNRIVVTEYRSITRARINATQLATSTIRSGPREGGDARS
jgi:hypothetical protein